MDDNNPETVSTNSDEEAYLEDLEARNREQTLPPTTTEQDLNNAEKAVSLNEKLDNKYDQLQKVLNVRLVECRERLADVRQSRQTSSNRAAGNSQQVSHFVFTGNPYFKDRDGVSAPANEDTIKIGQSGMYDLSNIKSLPDWTSEDKEDLYNEIMKFIREKRQEELKSNLKCLVLKLKENKKKFGKILQKDITALRKEIRSIKAAVNIPLQQDYDWEVIARELNFKHTPEECQAFWKTVTKKKEINMKKWDKTEQKKLCEVAIANKHQDWDKIARELGTGRTGFECFVFFRRNFKLPNDENDDDEDDYEDVE